MPSPDPASRPLRHASPPLGLVSAIYAVWLTQALGGSGFSVPFGLLVAGVSIPAARLKLLPGWLVIFGIALAVCGELSWLNLLAPQFLPLVPLTRFPGFVWMIAVGVVLPTTRAGAKRQEAA
ncbi:MAG: hypothetical protein DMF89_09560 [Acidobacteria bacterium]|nr:MAG: hypothetical protein DMF90_16455 [Acidobacteriota bacterium]PYR50397.1 MAG: hypothetical protein DMF89_09560 [Acidobacteriota bacterium]